MVTGFENLASYNNKTPSSLWLFFEEEWIRETIWYWMGSSTIYPCTQSTRQSQSYNVERAKKLGIKPSTANQILFAFYVNQTDTKTENAISL